MKLTVLHLLKHILVYVGRRKQFDSAKIFENVSVFLHGRAAFQSCLSVWVLQL